MTPSPRLIDVSAFIDERRLSPFNIRLIILSWFITVFDGFDMLMISFTAPYMRDELGLDTIMLGEVFSAGTIGMVIGGFAFTWFADRVGRRPAVILAAFAFGILTFATGFARTYHALLVLRFLDGLALGGLLPLAWALNIEFVPRRFRATVVTIIMVGYSLGSVIAGPLTNLMAPTYGWEGVFIVGGLGTIACAAALYLGLPESVRFLVSKGRSPERVVATLRKIDPAFQGTPQDRYILGDETEAPRRFHPRELFRGRLGLITPLLWLGYFMSSMGIYFISSWGPLLMEELNVERQTAAWVASVGGLMGAGAGLLLMRFTDRFGPISVAVYPAVAVPLLLILGFGTMPIAAFLVLMTIANTLVGGGHSGVISIAGGFYPSAIRASGAGWASSIGKFGGIFGPIIGAAILASDLPVQRSFAFLALCPAMLAICTFAMRGAGGSSAPLEAAPSGRESLAR